MRDIRICESEAEKYEALRERYEQIWQGGAIDATEDVIPTREDFATVYNFIRRRVRFGEEVFTVREMLLREEPLSSLGYIKLRFIINVLLEMNIVGVEEIGEEKYSFKLHYQNKHTDLEKSALLRRLRMQQRKA